MRYTSVNVQNCEHATEKAAISCGNIFKTTAKTNISGARKEIQSELFYQCLKWVEILNKITY